MTVKQTILAVISLCGLETLPVSASADDLIGFDAAGSSAQLALEKQLDASVDSADLRG